MGPKNKIHPHPIPHSSVLMPQFSCLSSHASCLIPQFYVLFVFNYPNCTTSSLAAQEAEIKYQEGRSFFFSELMDFNFLHSSGHFYYGVCPSNSLLSTFCKIISVSTLSSHSFNLHPLHNLYSNFHLTFCLMLQISPSVQYYYSCTFEYFISQASLYITQSHFNAWISGLFTPSNLGISTQLLYLEVIYFTRYDRVHIQREICVSPMFYTNIF